MSVNNPRPPIKQRILELWVLGLTYDQISEKLKEEHFTWGVSRRTVAGFLASLPKFPDPAPAFKEELLRRQLMDIAISDVSLRLKWRAHLLNKLYPTKYHEEITETVKESDIDLREFSEAERAEILRYNKRMLESRRAGEK